LLTYIQYLMEKFMWGVGELYNVTSAFSLNMEVELRCG